MLNYNFCIYFLYYQNIHLYHNFKDRKSLLVKNSNYKMNNNLDCYLYRFYKNLHIFSMFSFSQSNTLLYIYSIFYYSNHNNVHMLNHIFSNLFLFFEKLEFLKIKKLTNYCHLNNCLLCRYYLIHIDFIKEYIHSCIMYIALNYYYKPYN